MSHEDRKRLVLGRLRSACTDGTALVELHPIALDSIESVQLSRYQRSKPQNWLKRLVGHRAADIDDVVQFQLRSAQREYACLAALCSDAELLMHLPWLDRKGVRVDFPSMARTVLTLLEAYSAQLLLGEINEKPKELGLLHVSRKQGAVLRCVSQSPPDKIIWKALCKALDACSDNELESIFYHVRVRLEAWPASLKRAPPSWKNLRGCTPYINPRLVLASPEFSKIRTLETSVHRLRHDDVRDLAALPHFSYLKTLDLKKHRVGDEGAQILASSQHLTGLRELQLSKNGIGDAGASALASSRGLTRLARLDLSSNNITHEGALALLQSTSLTALTHINLRRNPIREAADLKSLFSKELVFGESWPQHVFTDDTARAFVASPHFRRQKKLKISSEHATLFIEALDTAHPLELESLEINQSYLKEIEVLAASPQLPHLTTFSLSLWAAGDAGAAALAQAPHWPALRSLVLTGPSQPSSAGVMLLLTSEHLALTHLRINSSQIPKEQKKHLTSQAQARGIELYL